MSTTFARRNAGRNAGGEAGADAAFTLRQRLVLGLVSWLGYLLISLIGRTLHFEWSSEPGGVAVNGEPPPVVIGPFWHRAVIPATWYFRGRGMAVMTSRSFDGEYIARIIERFGFVAVRGSSSRGGPGALLGMNRALASGHIAAFTIDGPRGPRFVAKPGPVLLARMSGVPILCFYLAAERPWLLRSWDAMMVPRPFSKVHVRWTKLIHVPGGASEEEMKQYQQQMQESLERARRDAVAALGARAS
jgi:lysophospholipid acyltransferase (LPLAT)-like uncharacterized protein